jgi:hypothetical protein
MTFLGCIPATGKKCVVFTEHKKKRGSIYWCSECEAGLCLATLEISAFNPVACITHKQRAYVIR